MKSYITLFLSTVSLLSIAQGNEELHLPAGATDLIPDQRFNEFKPTEQKQENTRWLIAPEDIEIQFDEEFQADRQPTINSLLIENQKLKERVSKLEQRLQKLEEHLSIKE